MSEAFAFPSDSSDDSEEYDEHEMAGPEALLFKKFGEWPTAAHEGAQRHGATKQLCSVCNGSGWLWVLPPPPSQPSKSTATF